MNAYVNKSYQIQENTAIKEWTQELEGLVAKFRAAEAEVAAKATLSRMKNL
jgi:hypothetical protein